MVLGKLPCGFKLFWIGSHKYLEIKQVQSSQGCQSREKWDKAAQREWIPSQK
jgi:hypothetical protein